jgi:NTP pyrophosphatase (non-canonical NTP hydrolase)
MLTKPIFFDAAIARRAIEKWGASAQIDMCIEECSELIDALCKHRRGRCNDDHVAEEIIDVSIMLSQMALLFDANAQNRWYDIKIQSLIDKLNTSTNAS